MAGPPTLGSAIGIVFRAYARKFGEDKEKWGKLTDDDLTAINGRRDQLEGKIQERCDLTAVAGTAFGRARVRKLSKLNDWGVETSS